MHNQLPKKKYEKNAALKGNGNIKRSNKRAQKTKKRKETTSSGAKIQIHNQTTSQLSMQ